MDYFLYSKIIILVPHMSNYVTVAQKVGVELRLRPQSILTGYDIPNSQGCFEIVLCSS